MLLPIYFLFFEILVLATSHILNPSDPNSSHLENKSATFTIDPDDGKLGVLDEVNAEIPPKDKDGVYYFIITLFVLTVVASTVTTGGFLVLSVLLWWHFKNMKFFWFLIQLTFSVFVVSTLNLVINIPATLFEMITTNFVTSEIFIVMSYIIDMCHYTFLFSNLVIAVQRFFVFFLRHLTDRVYDAPFIFLWLAFVWIASGSVVFILAYNRCRYRYMSGKNYQFYCTPVTNLVNLPPPAGMKIMEICLQFITPILIFGIYISIIVKILLMRKSLLNKTEVSILKQAMVIFAIFQISSLVFIFCQTFTFGVATAFLIKRIINTAEIFAGAATPCFFFFTSKDVRKLLSTRVSAVSSQNNSQDANRRQTMRSM